MTFRVKKNFQNNFFFAVRPTLYSYHMMLIWSGLWLLWRQIAHFFNTKRGAKRKEDVKGLNYGLLASYFGTHGPPISGGNWSFLATHSTTGRGILTFWNLASLDTWQLGAGVYSLITQVGSYNRKGAPDFGVLLPFRSQIYITFLPKKTAWDCKTYRAAGRLIWGN